MENQLPFNGGVMLISRISAAVFLSLGLKPTCRYVQLILKFERRDSQRSNHDPGRRCGAIATRWRRREADETEAGTLSTRGYSIGAGHLGPACFCCVSADEEENGPFLSSEDPENSALCMTNNGHCRLSVTCNRERPAVVRVRWE